MKNLPNQPPVITLGACGHPVRTEYADIPAQMAVVNSLGLKTYRFDLNLTSDASPDPATLLTNLLASATPLGIKLRPIIQVPFSYGDATDGGLYPNTLAGLTSQGYNRCHAIIDVFGDRITDWELSNELTLKGGIKTGGATGENANDFNTTLGFKWAAVYKGFSNAVGDIKTARGWALRRVIDIVYVDFGFVPFLQNNGGIVDKLAYHYYYNRRTSPYRISAPDKILDLFATLGGINLPVVINEFNAAEVYDPNRVPFSAYNDGHAMLSLAMHLQYIFGQVECNIEGVEFYELFDEPSKLPDLVESNFGLMADATTAKNQSLLAKFYSGAVCTTAELATIRSLAEAWRSL